MSTAFIHLQQAQHNKKLANYLLRHQRYKDWVVTTCFYIAVHLVEAIFFTLHPRTYEHSETTIPPKQKNRPSFSFHSWRKELIKELVQQRKLSSRFLSTYQNLHDQSNISRYLMIPSKTYNVPPTSLNKLAKNYFSYKDINDFIKLDLYFLEQEASNCGVQISSIKQCRLANLLKRFFKK